MGKLCTRFFSRSGLRPEAATGSGEKVEWCAGNLKNMKAAGIKKERIKPCLPPVWFDKKLPFV
ncbi:MAG: hypothetical protein LBM56_05340 [Burkholderiaceae bacterium]|jgi:hypothetical protein|nr:hypothetical protein [Burkholderiaceae bacterium]